MLPPPCSRQSSYVYPTHARRASSPSAPNRIASFRSVAETALGLEPEDDEEEQELRDELGMDDEAALAEEQRERGLEETLERLGFGAYHWRLLALCGFGWMSDNSALQCIAVILPRVQVHFNLSSKVVGVLSASTMAGMMVGAVGWGVLSDLLGRTLPFNATLFLTGIFGVGASFSPSFAILCCWMFCLGSAVGGSMPTDGTLFLENLPHSKQYLLTLLSVFFSFGAVLSSVISLVFLPGASCGTYDGCDIDEHENDGWKRVLFVLGLFNLVCALSRWFLFRLQESPRYLVSNGREREAIVALQTIADFNDRTINIQRADVQSRECSAAELSTRSSPFASPSKDEESVSYGGVESDAGRQMKNKPVRSGSSFYKEDENDALVGSFVQTEGQIEEERERLMDVETVQNDDGEADMSNRSTDRLKARNVPGGKEVNGWKKTPVVWWKSWIAQMAKLFVPQWRRTVILMWIIWGSMSYAYTMFNVWLPAVLESRAKGHGDAAIKEALGDFVLYSLAGCPGSIVGAWMVQTRLGRRKSLAICTLCTGLSTFAFIHVQQKWAVVVSSMVISAAATAMYAVLYGMTPETFGTSIRGTACGTSAALSRLTGVIAPVLAGFLLTITPSLPLFTSAAVFCMTAACSMALPFERAEGAGRGSRMMH
ncbi:membrane transporter [Cryptococcus deuterogattii MMRL2647]|nr:membrane transporter [Cryptococcus deuterogattii MMRL2647]